MDKKFFIENKSRLYKISYVLTILLMIAFMISTCVLASELNAQENNVSNNLSSNDFEFKVDNSEFLELSVGRPQLLATASGTPCVSQQVIATVKPETAKNKNVKWTLTWQESNDANISDYVTVTPTNETGSNVKVNCFKAFKGDIVLTAISEESEFKATCSVRFVGIPSSIAVTGPINPTSENTYGVAVNKEYVFDVNATNIFNSVGAGYNNITATIKGVGSFNVGNYEVSKRYHTGKWVAGTDKVITLDSIKNNFITVSCSNNKLTIKTLRAIESYQGTTDDRPGEMTFLIHDKFKSFKDECYFEVTLRETESGISKTLVIKFDNTIVTGLDVNTHEVVF